MKYVSSIIAVLFCLALPGCGTKPDRRPVVGRWSEAKEHYSISVLRNGSDVTGEVELFDGDEAPPSVLLFVGDRILCIAPVFGDEGIDKAIIYDLTGRIEKENGTTARLSSQGFPPTSILAANRKDPVRSRAVNIAFKLETGDSFDVRFLIISRSN